MAEIITRDEVAKHNTEDSLWCIIDHRVYDLTDFVDAHPGGNVVLLQVAGKDATVDFYNLHRQEVLQKYKDELCIGTVKDEKPEVIEPEIGGLSPVPYGEPLWLRPQFSSPYFKDSHRRLQKAMREFTERYIVPEGTEKEKDGSFISQELINRMAETNILAMRLGPGKHLHGLILPGGVKGEEFDYFHDLVVAQEVTRISARGMLLSYGCDLFGLLTILLLLGFTDGNMAGMVISLTAVRQWLRNEPLQKRITDEVLSGKKKICLAVTEAFAGSDVAGLRTTATKTPDGKHYIVNGTKYDAPREYVFPRLSKELTLLFRKWITNGMFADYFVTGCRTDKGFSVILIPRDENVETKQIKTSYSTSAGTAFVQFDNVKVPVENLMGEEHKGFIVIMSNFNHERFMMVGGALRGMRSVTEECMKWCNQRIVFKKKLIDQPVMRQK